MKRIALWTALTLLAAFLSAGDLAVLENLGFSADGRYFMFGQHVTVPSAGQVYAEIGIVNVPSNDFVPSGWKKKTWNLRMLPNQESRGALYELLSEMSPYKTRYGIDHLQQGKVLYLKGAADEKTMSMDGGDTASGLMFRDFERGRAFILALTQSTQTGGSEVSAAFSIQITIENSDGTTASYQVGRPSYMRAGVASYSIARVWLGPNSKSLAIAIAKEAPDLSVRYMVETLVIN
ncbi:MAG: hypothetical protein B0D92_06585 [Spirochaeta sp. LUC14_002_19_P3]|nr:MAG: hypothetical protein B0D92_06585 [Spirochaeta sp. LUC14_002_19_P3]